MPNVFRKFYTSICLARDPQKFAQLCARLTKKGDHYDHVWSANNAQKTSDPFFVMI